MRHFALVLVALFVLCSVVLAQENDQKYRLRVPSAEEYVEIMAVSRQIEETSYIELDLDNDNVGAAFYATMESNEALNNLMEREFLQRYGTTADYETLNQAYEILNWGADAGYANYFSFIDIPSWNKRLVQRWLKENPTDLNIVNQLEFAPYSIAIERHNLDGEGDTEIILQIRRDDYADNWLALPNENTEGKYLFISSPFPYRAENFWWSQSEGLGSKIVAIEDMNGDSKLEWIATSINVFPGTINVGAYKNYYIVNWYDSG